MQGTTAGKLSENFMHLLYTVLWYLNCENLKNFVARLLGRESKRERRVWLLVERGDLLVCKLRRTDLGVVCNVSSSSRVQIRKMRC